MIRVGVDLGGTKIEAAALDAQGRFLARRRVATPSDYDASILAVRDLVDATEQEAGCAGIATVGVGMPGSLSRVTGRVRNANSTWLNGRPFDVDLSQALGRPIRVANDANCFALSEAVDGAGAGSKVVFAAILGTGCGGGLAVGGALIDGFNGVAGEWGHTPLPWATPDERSGHDCWCGRAGCLETWISGTAFGLDYPHRGGKRAGGAEIAERSRAGEPAARACLSRYIDRLSRGLAVVCDIVDPDVIVLGGGMSNIPELYPAVESGVARHLFSDSFRTPVRPAAHGDSSGVRGAAWLWPGP